MQFVAFDALFSNERASSSHVQLGTLRRSTMTSQDSLSPEIGRDQISAITKLICPTGTATTRSMSPVPGRLDNKMRRVWEPL